MEIKSKVIHIVGARQQFIKYGAILNISDLWWIFLNTGSNIVIGLIGSIIFARLAGAEYFGKYQYIFSLNGIASLILLPGLENALINSAVKNTEGDFIIAFKKRKKLLPFFILFFIIASVVIFVKKKNIDIALSFFIVGFLSGLISLFNYYLSYFIGKKEYKNLFICQSLISLSSILVVIGYFILSRVVGLSYVLLSILILIPLSWNFFIYFFIYLYVRKRLKYTNSFSDDFMPYAKNLSYMSIIGAIQSNLDNFIIGTFLSYHLLAFYSIAKKLLEVLKNLWVISQQYLQPRLVKKEMMSAFDYFKKYLNIYWVVIPFLGLLWLILPTVIKLLYGQQFIKASSYARLFLFVILAGIPNFYLEAFFRAHQFYKDLYYGRIINLLSLATLAIFVYYLQVYGIIINRILTAFGVTFMMNYLLLRRVYIGRMSR
jgi:O-antigen/teichoic acid export membrane protein